MGDIFDDIAAGAFGGGDSEGALSTGSSDIFDQAAASAFSEPTVPSFSSDPIGALTSKAWWTTPQGEPTLVSDFVHGVEDTPGALYDIAKATPSGFSNLFQSVVHPIDSIQNGTTEKVLRGLGKGALTTAGTIVRGPVGGAVGGKFFDKLLQVTGIDPETDIHQDLRDISHDTGLGVGGNLIAKGAGVVGEQVAKIPEKIGASFDDAATAFREKLLGVQYGDKKGALGANPVYLDEAGNVVPRSQAIDASSSLQERLGTLEDSGFFKRTSNNPSEALGQLASENALTQQAIGELIKKADSVLGDEVITPEWTRAQKYLNGLRESERNALAPEFAKIKADFAADSNFGLQRIINLKNQLADDAKFASNVAPKKAELFQQAYHDLRALGEKVFDDAIPDEAGAFRNANQLAAAQATFLKTLPKSVAKSRPGVVETFFTPTGSGAIAGGSGLTAALLGNATIPVALGVGWLGRAIYKGVTNKYPVTVSNVLSGTGDIGSTLSTATKAAGSVADALAPEVGLASQLSNLLGEKGAKETKVPIGQKEGTPNKSSAPRSDNAASLQPTSSSSANQYSFMNTLFKGDKMDKIPTQLFEEIKKDPIDHAVMLMESGGDPKAKNPTSSASGLFQLLKSTAKNLGVKDAFDAEENYIGYKKLRDETKDLTGDDPALVYAAHYLGAPVFRKMVRGAELSADEQKQVDYLRETLLPRFLKIYQGVTKTGQVEA